VQPAVPATANPAVPATNERDNVTLLPSILPPRATSGNDLAAARPSGQHDEAGIDLHANLIDYNELEIAKALARHSVEIGIAPNHVVPEGKMRIVGIMAKKISSNNAVSMAFATSHTQILHVARLLDAFEGTYEEALQHYLRM